MARTLIRLGTLLGTLLVLLTAVSPAAMAGGAKPPAPYPAALSQHDIGINKKTGEYCAMDSPDAAVRQSCRPQRDCEDFPAGMTVCVGEGGSEPGDALHYEQKQLTRWQDKTDHTASNYTQLSKYLTTCVNDKHKTFQQCMIDGTYKYPPPKKSPSEILDWVGGKISSMAMNALEEAAAALGHSVVWLLKQFAGAFNSISTVSLAKTGIGPVMGISTGVSVLVATFLLLIQFAKLGISQQGGPLVTAITGLAKWAAILSVYVLATQTALKWSDTFSTALINYTFDGGGSGSKDASQAMSEQLGTLFAGLVGTGGGGAAASGALITGSTVGSSAVGFVIVISILCILAIGALWVEMLVRQAGIMILVVVMPVVLAGQMSDATREWWPKARNAAISLILMKPVIVIAFSIGFSAMAGGTGVRNVIVGLIIFIIAGFSWPVLAKFMTFTTNGAGNSTASGVISSVGSSVSSMFGGNQPSLSGSGTVGGGGNYTKALDADNSSSSSSGGGGGGSFWSKVGGTVGMGLQMAAVGKDMLESTGANTAANAGLDSGVQGGRHVVIPPRGRGGGGAPSKTAAAATEGGPPTAPGTQESQPPPVQPSENSGGN
jgi:hypothetical protein